MRLSVLPSLSTPPKCQNVTINNIPFSILYNSNPYLPFRTPVASSHYPILSNSTPISRPPTNDVITRCQSSISTPQNSQEDDDDEEEDESLVQDLRVPTHWLLPSKALEESQWLKVTLHKWLDDEYCPEETNVEISKVAAQSYYVSLLEKQTDLGDILLNMARNLESISYKESFHGAFSSANAAVNLIVQRIELQARVGVALLGNDTLGEQKGDSLIRVFSVNLYSKEERYRAHHVIARQQEMLDPRIRG